MIRIPAWLFDILGPVFIKIPVSPWAFERHNSWRVGHIIQKWRIQQRANWRPRDCLPTITIVELRERWGHEVGRDGELEEAVSLYIESHSYCPGQLMVIFYSLFLLLIPCSPLVRWCQELCCEPVCDKGTESTVVLWRTHKWIRWCSTDPSDPYGKTSQVSIG